MSAPPRNTVPFTVRTRHLRTVFEACRADPLASFQQIVAAVRPSLAGKYDGKVLMRFGAAGMYGRDYWEHEEYLLITVGQARRAAWHLEEHPHQSVSLGELCGKHSDIAVELGDVDTTVWEKPSDIARVVAENHVGYDNIGDHLCNVLGGKTSDGWPCDSDSTDDEHSMTLNPDAVHTP